MGTCSLSVKKASSSVVGGHLNVCTCAKSTGCGGHISGCSGFGVGGVAFGFLDVDDGAHLLAGGATIVTLDFTVCSDYLGADNALHSLAGEAVMVTLGRTHGDTGQRVESGGPTGGDLKASQRG